MYNVWWREKSLFRVLLSELKKRKYTQEQEAVVWQSAVCFSGVQNDESTQRNSEGVLHGEKEEVWKMNEIIHYETEQKQIFRLQEVVQVHKYYIKIIERKRVINYFNKLIRYTYICR